MDLETALPAAVSCPICGSGEVAFSGIQAGVYLRSHFNVLAPYLCHNSHTFFLPVASARRERVAAAPEPCAERPVLEFAALLARCRAERARAERLCEKASHLRLALRERWGQPRTVTVH